MDLLRDNRFRQLIRQIPKGKVATYSQVAAAAGYPMLHRRVAQVLRKGGAALPWQRVVGAGGEIRTRLDHGEDQRLRLRLEGVTFHGRKVNMEAHRYFFNTWDE